MRDDYDFSNGKRGPVVKDGKFVEPGNVFENEALLLELKKEGELKQTSYYNQPTIIMESADWLLSYAVENFIRTLAISRMDGNTFQWETFYAAFPLIEKIFGKPTQEFPHYYENKRGHTWVLQLNDFFENPFFVTAP